mmetsp:Transcript_18487/g.43290  ORF Transcript_18487/g.43290 Transcript_18487/m.43290 type:complete len:183 (-) Transcript_18487:168-716(-)|eukprot:CAMPEP_0178459926 /NCGR_PEP_ID=MMETSP0689_2-20121128/48404_1 /TAXON_ID=160604 /ORGANISM="Amphidinium massartii, Strain CS-259" /LENGTH=182 /DNA_ID=CAMNT_0020086463 /DNA_START=122 /DNA_END=670 /DNA_ORIENTATION=-
MGNNVGCVENCNGENEVEFISTLSVNAEKCPPPNRTTFRSVVVHLYDLSENIRAINGALETLGFGGAFHVGVECFGKEWSYGFDGVTASLPKKHTNSGCFIYRKSFELGEVSCSQKEFDRILDVMSGEWHGDDYDLLTRNCVCFCNELCENLGLGGLPSKVTRLSRTAAAVPGSDMLVDRIL